MFSRKKTAQELEQDFFKKARTSARLPGVEQRKAAQKAFDSLPENSKFKKVKFEGLKK
jgi:hypothetical protein